MKALIVIAAAAIAFPVYAQQKQDVPQTLPSAQERAQNREKVQAQTDKATEKLPSADERAKNRETVSSGTAGAALTTKVKTALASDAGLSTMTNIDVDSKDGVVTLKGKVDSADMKKKAGDVAKKVSGVKSVKNELKVEKKS
ncbi:MAG TPA: BON domain-containing protein [Burkholderiales bacterium]|jgi:hyperosmotically inducible protein|nr:BON domain-containing protein [Burkholderiales bacterium]